MHQRKIAAKPVNPSEFGAVVIGRNEGGRLKTCLDSLSAASIIVYVDSGSTDESIQIARSQGAEVVQLDLSIPFTAARARNAGFASLRQISPGVRHVQFVDGDCEIAEKWLEGAAVFLQNNPDIAAVCGKLSERYPERSLYNWLCQREWDGPIGELRACAGNVMMSAAAIQMVGGYRDDLIAGEEAELCIRLRRSNWRIWRINREMAMHDANIQTFSQWWRRSVRNGYAFAEGAYLHGAKPERHWVWESERAWLWGIGIPVICLFGCLTYGARGLVLWLIYPFQLLRQTVRRQGSVRERLITSIFQTLIRFPEAVGQIKFWSLKLLGRQSRLIEYK